MTHVIKARNVNHALVDGLWWLCINGEVSDSRNGMVKVSPCPVVTEYFKPDQRVLFDPLRDANPFFHLLEGLWMLSGENDVKFVSHYAANMKNYSDDGETLHGAYGYRWRTAMGLDQLELIIRELKVNPQSRRCVLQMWDSGDMNDLGLAINDGKDVPCNTQAYFDTLGGKLNMTVTCRSNDVIWGCYGANAVHFSMLLEYVALCTGIPMGMYRQFSNNYHMYLDLPVTQALIKEGRPSIHVQDPYTDASMEPHPLLDVTHPHGVQDWHADMAYFFSRWTPTREWQQSAFFTPFWKEVVLPLVEAHQQYKEGYIEDAIKVARLCKADDWRTAATDWLRRREANRVK